MGSSGQLRQNTVRRDWLALHREDALDPQRPIVDTHHHLYVRGTERYLLEDYIADVDSGHNVTASVLVQARSMLRATGPDEMKPVGETEFANGVAAMAASGLFGNVAVGAGIVGYADLRCGDGVARVLEAHRAAAPQRFRGIRQISVWDPDPALVNSAYRVPQDMFDTPEFRSGFERLADYGLSFDAWLYFHQLPRLTALARACPQVQIVVDHCGGVLGIEAYRDDREAVFASWSAGLRELAGCPNVMIKLSGLGMRISGFGFDECDRPPSSGSLAQSWRPWIETCIEAFGADRCMYGSNFPVDAGSYSYAVGLNALKHIVKDASEDEKTALFSGSAKRFYRLE